MVLVLIALFLYKKLNKPQCLNCNVILVSLDTLGSNHLPCYGYFRNTSPNLCQFAGENILFKNSYSNAPWTLPSHFSIFTSLYPKHHAMFLDNDVLDERIKTLPEVLKQHNYQTIYVGPEDDPKLPLDKGFERGFDKFFTYMNIQTTKIRWEDGLKTFSENAQDGKSTFMFLHTYWVHAPYVVGDMTGETGRMFTEKNIEELPLNYFDFWTNFSQDYVDFVLGSEDLVPDDFKNRLKGASLVQAREILNSAPDDTRYALQYNYYTELLKRKDLDGEYSRALYDETIYHLDQTLVKRLIDFISSDAGKNTILIITSDHGEEFMEHGNFGHPADALYNTTTSVPLIMHIPGFRAREIDQMVEGVDIFPTVLRLLGIGYGPKIDGVDLSGLILGKSGIKTKSHLISQGWNIDSIRDVEWKLYMKGTDQEEVYNLKFDAAEKNNVSSERESVVKDLKDRFFSLIYSDFK